MSDKQVDGIKKLNKEELRRSRNIVLALIGENEKKKTTSKENYLINDSHIAKKVDGLSELSKKSVIEKPSKAVQKKVLSEIDNEKKNLASDEKTKSTPSFRKNTNELSEKTKIKKLGFWARIKNYSKKRLIKKQIAREAKEKIKALKLEKKRRVIQENKEIEKQKNIKKALPSFKIKKEVKKQNKILTPRLNSTSKKVKDIKEPKIKDIKEIISITGYEMMEKEGVDFVADLDAENLKKSKKKNKTLNIFKKKIKSKNSKAYLLEQKAKKKELEEKKLKNDKIKKAVKVKKRQQRIEQRQIRNEKIKFFLKTLNHKILSLSKRSIYTIIIIFTTGIVIYFLILISIVQFDVDNNITRTIAKRIPIPAYISTDGIIEYFKYKEIKESILSNSEMNGNIENEVKESVVKRLVLEKLIKKYNLLVHTDESLVEQIATQLSFDMEVNLVPINRIKKIKKMINKEGDFIRVATKYGDELGQITLDYDNSKKLNYFDSVKSLELGDVSDIVFTPEGYYIFKCFDKDSVSIALSYVFIKSNTLDDYIDDEVRGYRLISFVD